MHRTFLAFVVCAAVAIGGMSLARHEDHGKQAGPVRVLSQRDITEKVDGKKTKATTVEVTLKPGQASAPHRHPGPVFGYVIEGEYEWAINDNPVKTLKAGDTFYEPTGCLHRVSRNPAEKGMTRILAVVLHAQDTRQITLPEKSDAKE